MVHSHAIVVKSRIRHENVSGGVKPQINPATRLR